MVYRYINDYHWELEIEEYPTGKPSKKEGVHVAWQWHNGDSKWSSIGIMLHLSTFHNGENNSEIDMEL